jgi:hypothetical protein
MSAVEGEIHRRSGWLAALAILASSAAWPATAPPPTAESIVARHVAARGGASKIRSIRTLRQTGRAIGGPSREALVTRELKRPSKTRFEFTVQGLTAVYAFDGQRGWSVSPFDATMDPQPLSDDVTREAVEQGDIEGPLVDWEAKGHRLARSSDARRSPAARRT